MDLISLPLSQLEPHPLNSNVMPDELLTKLAAHLARTGLYPPVIVRPIQPDAPSPAACGFATNHLAPAPRYQILDGHHRVLALHRLGETTARCDVWNVDDAEALTLLATLNRLQGQDDPKKRGRLIAAIRRDRGVDLTRLCRELPERTEQARALVALNDAPRARPPRTLDELPAAVHFFLLSHDRARLERRLREIGGSREEALMKLLEANPITERILMNQ